MQFDYGGEVQEIGSNFKLWKTEGNRTALVDADLLPYIIGYITDEQLEVAALAKVDSGEAETIKDTLEYQETFDCLCATLNNWINAAGCDSARLYITVSDKNFRLNIAYTTDYKGQRPAKKPPFYHALKEDVEKRLGAIAAVGEEADDLLSIDAYDSFYRDLGSSVALGSQQHKELCTTVTITSDKDSSITPTWHFDPMKAKLFFNDVLGELSPEYIDKKVKVYEQVPTGEFFKRGKNKGKPKTKRVCTGEAPSTSIKKLRGTGLKFFYAQIIMGDSADNYKGLKSCGQTKAYETLVNCKSEKELYLATLSLYKEVYGEGKHFCPHYKGTEEYYKCYVEKYNKAPEDWEQWKDKGAYLTAYQRMLEQGRLAWMQTKKGEIWRADKGSVIDPHDITFWNKEEEK